MLKATLTPPKMTTRTLWGGVYGGHYDIIVFFTEKPVNRVSESNDEDPAGKYIDVYDEYKAENVYADMPLETFNEWFPGVDLTPYTQENGRPKDTEIPFADLFQITLTLPVDENDQPLSIDFHADW